MLYNWNTVRQIKNRTVLFSAATRSHFIAINFKRYTFFVPFLKGKLALKIFMHSIVTVLQPFSC